MRTFQLIGETSPPPTSRVVVTAPPGVVTAPPGVVAEGVEWSDGTVAVRWREDPPSTVLWGSVDALMAVASRGGVRIEWTTAPG